MGPDPTGPAGSHRTGAGPLRQISTAQGDGARTAAIVLQGHATPRALSLAEVAESFAELARTAGQAGKIRLLRELFSACHPEEAARITGILLGDLRIGLKEGLLEEALAEAFGRDPAAVREAHLLLGDLGETARLARADELGRAGATWFTPLRVMLSSPAEDATEIVTRLGSGGPVWLEDKFDGIRAQLHVRGGAAALYSRDLRPLEAEFPN